MKTPRSFLTASALLAATTLVTSGCYTEFMLADSDSEEQTPEPCVITLDPIFAIDYLPPVLYAGPEYAPPPAGSGPPAPAQPATPSPSRDSGKRRVPPPPAPVIPTPRPVAAPPAVTGGSTLPTPAPAAPARTAESRPSPAASGRR